MLKLSGIGLAGLLLLTAAGARAADAPAPYDPRGGRDQAILRQLHQQNQDAIAAAQLAEERATRDEVRDYAAKVISQRQQSDAQLFAYAQAAGMNVPEIQSGPLANARLDTAPPDRFNGEFAAHMNALAQADVDHALEAERLAQGPSLHALIRDSILPRLVEQEYGATTLVAVLPPLPPPAVQQPGGFPYPSWTNLGHDEPPPGVLR